jgi:hypothetical protein
MTSTYTHKKERYENQCVQICEKLINDTDTTLLLTPITNKRYIKHEKRGIFIVIHEGSLKITNHVYSYMIFIEGDGYRKIIDDFNREVERRRLQMEREIDSNIKHSLMNILNDLTK